MSEDNIVFSGLYSAMIFGLIIGLRHSTDGDHVVAVSTMARDYRSIFKGLWIGVSWGLGHSTPLLFLGILILFIKDSLLESYEAIAPVFEFGVAVMLVLLGLQVFWKIYRSQFHIHGHDHDGGEHKHLHGSHVHQGEHEMPHESSKHGIFPELFPFFRFKSYAIGVVHGLAGSAAVLIVILPASPDLLSGMMFLLFFSLGTMVAMAMMTVLLSLPFAVSSKSNNLGNVIICIAGLLSVTLGLALGSDILFETGFTRYLWY
ncbi:hypothetical protein FIM02_01535 [SAR202 cluster bacterium AD-802-E10_MRT_200m]|nr:hypothetical protein [SAR202 cluster bacterium AD-802-E10_MRT_200m]